MSAIATNLRPHVKVTVAVQSADTAEVVARDPDARTYLSACAISLIVHACLLTACGLIWYAIPSQNEGLPSIDALMTMSDSDSTTDGQLQFEDALALV